MNNQPFFLFVSGLIVSATIVCQLGCGRPAPTAPKANPTQAAQEALRLYDTNGDGKISGSELDAVPAFKSVLSEMDTDRDKGISAPEIEARMNQWAKTDSKLVAASCSIKYNGKKVADGQLILEPEPFMGANFSVGRGEISEGTSQPTTENQGGYCAMPVGFYKARVEGGTSGAAGTTGIEIYDCSVLYQKSGVFPLEMRRSDK